MANASSQCVPLAEIKAHFRFPKSERRCFKRLTNIGKKHEVHKFWPQTVIGCDLELGWFQKFPRNLWEAIVSLSWASIRSLSHRTPGTIFFQGSNPSDPWELRLVIGMTSAKPLTLPYKSCALRRATCSSKALQWSHISPQRVFVVCKSDGNRL